MLSYICLGLITATNNEIEMKTMSYFKHLSILYYGNHRQADPFDKCLVFTSFGPPFSECPATVRLQTS